MFHSLEFITLLTEGLSQLTDVSFTSALQHLSKFHQPKSVPVHELWIHLLVGERPSLLCESIAALSSRRLDILSGTIRVLRGLLPDKRLGTLVIVLKEGDIMILNPQGGVD